jgi:hypothetical protein
VQLLEPLGLAGVHLARLFQLFVSHLWRVLLLVSQRAVDWLAHPPVLAQTDHERAWIIRPNEHYERRHAEQMPTGRLDQAGILPLVILLLSLWVNYYIDSFYNKSVPRHCLRLYRF